MNGYRHGDVCIEDLTEDDVGLRVVYRAAPDYAPQVGVITSWNKRMIFVRYGNDETSKATRPSDLEWDTL